MDNKDKSEDKKGDLKSSPNKEKGGELKKDPKDEQKVNKNEKKLGKWSREEHRELIRCNSL